MSAPSALRGVGKWVFGISLSVFLISMWGRAVVVDSQELAESLSPMARSSTVIHVFAEWFAGELVEAGADEGMVDGAVSQVMAQDTVTTALDRLVVDVITAAGAVEPGAAIVDVAGALEPASGDITDALGSALGSDVSEGRVSDVIAGLDPIVVRGPDAQPLVGPDSPAATRLGTAAVLALIVMGTMGWAITATSPSPLDQLRGLLARIAVGGLSFAVVLGLGSWVLSPDGGRAPIEESLGLLLGSKWVVPLAIGGVGAALGYGARLWVRRTAAGPASQAPIRSSVR